MKKKIIIPIIIILVLLVVGGLILFTRKYSYSDENTLYFVKFNDTILRFEHIDNVMPQNQIVAVQKSTNNGKTFETITEGQVIVSLEPKFVFFNEKLGFAVKKPNNTNENGKYYGMYVTTDGGKTFNQSEITYDNFNIEILTIEDVPFYENDKLKLHCSIYQVKSDQSGYETVDLYFITDDDGLTWYLENETKNDETIILGDPPNSVDSSYLYWIKINKKEACKNDINLYMKNNNNNIYYFCINELFVSFNPNLSSTPTLKMLSSWGNDINKTINDITSKMSIKEQFRDGGSIMYERDNLRILKCNTADGNKDIYIGYNNLEYKDGYCMRANLKNNKESKKIKNDNKSTYDELKAEFIGYANQFIIRSTYVFENNKAIACYMEIESDNELFLKPFPEDLSYLYDPLVKNVRYEGNKKYYEWSDEYFEEKGKGCSKAEIEDFLRDLGYTIIN